MCRNIRCIIFLNPQRNINSVSQRSNIQHASICRFYLADFPHKTDIAIHTLLTLHISIHQLWVTSLGKRWFHMTTAVRDGRWRKRFCVVKTKPETVSRISETARRGNPARCFCLSVGRWRSRHQQRNHQLRHFDCDVLMWRE